MVGRFPRDVRGGKRPVKVLADGELSKKLTVQAHKFSATAKAAIEAAGGPPITLCAAPNGKGGSWGGDDVIVFTPNANTPLHRVSASGGESQPITEIERGRHNSHRHPRFLPDGRHVLYLARGVNAAESAVMIASLEGDDDRELMRNIVQAEYAAGQLFFVRDQTLMAQPFDVEKLEFAGEAKPVAEQALTIPAAAFGVFSVSSAGILTYHVVPGRVMAADVVNLDTVVTLEGQSISISSEDGNVFLNGNVQVIITDIPAANGVIHVIDAVLLPPSM